MSVFGSSDLNLDLNLDLDLDLDLDWDLDLNLEFVRWMHDCVGCTSDRSPHLPFAPHHPLTSHFRSQSEGIPIPDSASTPPCQTSSLASRPHPFGRVF